MSITPENLPKHKLIGLKAEFLDSSDKSQEGISEKVTDETRSMLDIDEKKIKKRTVYF